MRKRKILWQLFPSYVLITVFALVALALYSAESIYVFYRDQIRENLRIQALQIAHQMQESSFELDSSKIDPFCKKLGKQIPTRITIILPDGKVIGDSQQNAYEMENHADRPEFIQAMKQPIGESSRHSFTANAEMKYVAIPIIQDGKRIAIVRTSMDMAPAGHALRVLYDKIAVVGFVTLIFAALVSLVVSRRLARPLQVLNEGAARFAKGDFRHKLVIENSEEIVALADSMNLMAAQLDERIRTILQQRNEQQAVLSSMSEGVFAVDLDEKIITFNEAAGRFLSVDSEKARNQTIQEAVRNTELQGLVRKVIESGAPAEIDILIRDKGERHFQAKASLLLNPAGATIGVLVILNDITQLRQIDIIRRDFVANVSHELKTPITSIKGFVETLIDGAMEDPEHGHKFLEIIARQADRLNAIIDDLLSLARIEQEKENSEIELVESPLLSVVRAAAETCQGKAQAKNIMIEVHCPENLTASINAPLLEQALVNLLDNAVKYSNASSRVRIETAPGENEVRITVQDWGMGIEEEHLTRLFERFYRVDKARSRNLGGTGLGLSIVKHIAQAHQGYVSVQSKLGKGSAFSIHLPRKAGENC